MTNALKFSPLGSVIVLDAEQSDDKITLSITDQGPGIPEAERERVFERFYRLEESGSDGSGLGLAIALQCAAQMGASILLQTPEVGAGLCVKINMAAA